MRRALQGLGWIALLALSQCASSHHDGAEPEPAGDGRPSPAASPNGQRELPGTAAPPTPAKQPTPAGARGEAGRRGDSAGAGKAAEPRAGSAGSQDDSDAGSQPAADGGQTTLTPEDSSCLSGIDERDYASAGPFEFLAESMPKLKLWVPKLPSGCKVPVVHFANGTGATCSNYQPVLERLASHGFLAVCAENPATGSGVLGLEALEAALSMHPELAAHKLGSAGHHAGGQGAILTLQQAEAKWGSRGVYAGLAFAPASGHGAQPPSGTWQDAYAAVKSPVLMISGSADALVSESWVGDGFATLNDATEAYWYSAVGAMQIPVPVAQLQEASVTWFRWKLLGDQRACAYFKRLPASDRWDARGEQSAKDCP
ncbi:MAG TPA: hypothetical protein VJR89_25335 [Polyangiales bacterium]|nr:hypothetical protein [Polyangiales bacterium]